MEITIFSKKRTTKEGKIFFNYLSSLKRKDGTVLNGVAVKFREEAGNPKPERCPMNIKFNREDANLSRREYVRDDTGEVAEKFTLWVSKWEQGAAYVDHSLDEFE